MSLVRLHLVAAAVLLATLAAVPGCASPQRPQLKVLGIEQSEHRYDGRELKLFVEVVNYARRPMRLQRLQYVFGPAGGGGTPGEVDLSRTVEAGSAIVVEVPILVDEDVLAAGDLELRGQLIAEQDEIIRAYPVTAEVDRQASVVAAPAAPDAAAE